MTAVNPNPAAAILTRRKEISVVAHSEGGKQLFVIEDHLRSAYFQIGVAEAWLLEAMDGSKSIEQLYNELQQQPCGQQLTQQDATAYCCWLVQAGLAAPKDAVIQPNMQATPKLWSLQNPLSLRIVLCHPDRILNQILPWTNWIFSKPARIAVVVLAFLAAMFVGQDWGRFTHSLGGIFDAQQWISLFVCWLGLKVVHEFAHGLACRRYGGYVKEAGILFILLFPIAFIDLTSSWRFSERRHRVATALAGMYVEIAAASIAAILWAFTGPGVFNQWLANCVVMASATTLIFNANPLMRFDGYFVLSDLLNIPNLYTHGQNSVRQAGRKWFLGLPTETSSSHSGLHRWIVPTYGIACWVWRQVISVGLIFAASLLFHGAGLILAALGLLTWYIAPTVRFVQFLIWGNAKERPKLLQFGFATSITALLVAAFSFLTPWPHQEIAPGVVDFPPVAAVRNETSGFVTRVFVHDGQPVDEGDAIVQLSNEVLSKEVAELELELRKLQLQLQALRQNKEVALLQVTQSQVGAIENQLREKQDLLRGLVVRAPISGRVVQRDIEQLLGRHFSAGVLLATIGVEDKKQIRISIAQPFVAEKKLDETLFVRIPGIGRTECEVINIKPQARDVTNDVALLAPYGGTLPCTMDEDHFRLLHPRVEATLAVPKELCDQVACGQRCYARLHPNESFAGRVYRWLQQRLGDEWGV
jgi:putative peptide zinc metalloprotease protein